MILVDVCIDRQEIRLSNGLDIFCLARISASLKRVWCPQEAAPIHFLRLIWRNI